MASHFVTWSGEKSKKLKKSQCCQNMFVKLLLAIVTRKLRSNFLSFLFPPLLTSLALAFKIEDSFNALSEYDTHERVKQHLLCLPLLGETQNSSQNFHETLKMLQKKSFMLNWIVKKCIEYEIVATRNNNVFFPYFFHNPRLARKWYSESFYTYLFYSFSDIRVQLNEQLKCLDNRLEIQMGIVNEFQDVFKRKAEIELNYCKELDRLAKSISHRHKEGKQNKWVFLYLTYIVHVIKLGYYATETFMAWKLWAPIFFRMSL